MEAESGFVARPTLEDVQIYVLHSRILINVGPDLQNMLSLLIE
jgi:hypothetical protein